MDADNCVFQITGKVPGIHSVDDLVAEFGNKEGITCEKHKNGQVRYRLKEGPRAPGVWIKKEDVYNRLKSYFRIQGDVPESYGVPVEHVIFAISAPDTVFQVKGDVKETYGLPARRLNN